MKNRLSGLIFVFLSAVTFPALAAAAPGPLIAQAQENGSVFLFSGNREVGYLSPSLFRENWNIVFFSGANSDATATLPEGTVAFHVSLAKDGAHGLLVHGTMTPAKDVRILSARMSLSLPYEDWDGDSYDFGTAKGQVPRAVVTSEGGMIASGAALSLGPSHAGVGSLHLSSKLMTFLQDVRQWTPDLSVFWANDAANGTVWTWKAGETRTFDIHLHFDQDVEIRAATPPSLDSLKAQISALIQPIIDGGWCPSMSVGILAQGQTLVLGFGKTSLDGKGSAPDGDTEYELGSITKLFTKLLLCDEIHRGQMGLEDKAQTYMPAGSTLPSKDGKEITLLTLANHTSGLPRYPETWDVGDRDRMGHYTLADLYNYLSHSNLLSDPGEKFLYSNLGVGLLGDLIALKEGQTYEALLNTRFLGPMELKDTAITWSPDQKARAATPYDGEEKPVGFLEWPEPTLMAAGALHSTANDLLKLARMTMDPNSPLLGPIAFDATAAQVSWGPIVQHDGYTYGSNSSFYVDRNAQKAFVVLSNAGSDLASQVGWRVRRLIMGEIPSPMKLPVIIEKDPAELKPYVGRYQANTVPSGWTQPDKPYEFFLKDGLLYGHTDSKNEVRDFEIYPLANGNFYDKKDFCEFNFTRDKQGQVTGYALTDYPSYTASRIGYKPPPAPGDDIPSPP